MADIVSLAIKKATITQGKWSQFFISLLGNGVKGINFIWPADEIPAKKWSSQVDCNLLLIRNCRKETWETLGFERIWTRRASKILVGHYYQLRYRDIVSLWKDLNPQSLQDTSWALLPTEVQRHCVTLKGFEPAEPSRY